MKSDYKIIGTVVLVSALVFIGLVWLLNGSQTPTAVDQAYLVGAEPHEKGAAQETAVLTIVEFSDFQCPACGAAAPLIAQFVSQNSGSVRLVYRHFPLVTIHPNARLAAVASEVAADFDKFWEFHDLLFENQQDWASLEDPTDMFVSYAQELEINTDEFAEKLTQSDYINEVRDDQVIANDLNLSSTPTFYFNGELYRGVPTQAVLDEFLAKAKN